MLRLQKLQEAIEGISDLDAEAMRITREKQDKLTKPKGSLGVLEELSIKVAGITGNPLADIKEKAIIVMVGDHGVVKEKVSAYPSDVTFQMVFNFLRGGAGINVLAKHVGAKVRVVDMGVAVSVDHPQVIRRKVRAGTANMAEGPAMSSQEALDAVLAGVEIVEEEVSLGVGIVGTGDMGIGNTTPSSAILAVLTGEAVEDVTGRGTGIDNECHLKKIETIKKAIALNQPDPNNPLDVLAKVGGLEIGGLCGAILGAARRRIPVVIDGFISGAAALLASRLAPKSVNYMIASHLSVEPGHQRIMREIGLSPMLYMDMRLGEGTGAALGISIVDAACKILREMATFEEAGVSEATAKNKATR